MEREACVCDHGFERSDLCAEIIIIIIINGINGISMVSMAYQWYIKGISMVSGLTVAGAGRERERESSISTHQE